VKRTILREIQDPLAQTLLSQGFAEGSTIRVRREGEGFSFS